MEGTSDEHNVAELVVETIADYVASEQQEAGSDSYSLRVRKTSRDITNLVLDGPTYPQIKATTIPFTVDVMAAYEFCRSTFGWPLTLSRVERINRVAQKHTN